MKAVANASSRFSENCPSFLYRLPFRPPSLPSSSPGCRGRPALLNTQPNPISWHTSPLPSYMLSLYLIFGWNEKEKRSLYVPALSWRMLSQTLQLKSSYPAKRSRPDLEKATDVIPQMMLSWEYMANSWSARMSNSRQVASSEPVANAAPFGKN